MQIEFSQICLIIENLQNYIKTFILFVTIFFLELVKKNILKYSVFKQKLKRFNFRLISFVNSFSLKEFKSNSQLFSSHLEKKIKITKILIKLKNSYYISKQSCKESSEERFNLLMKSSNVFSAFDVILLQLCHFLIFNSKIYRYK